jgi:hypothetical protein
MASLVTKKGTITGPCYIPQTAIGGSKIDALVSPYFQKLAPAVAVNMWHKFGLSQWHKFAIPQLDRDYSNQPVIGEISGIPLASEVEMFSFDGGHIGEITLRRCEHLGDFKANPARLSRYQAQHADVQVTLGFPLSSKMRTVELKRRQYLTIGNAFVHARLDPNNNDPILATIAPWDLQSALKYTDAYFPDGESSYFAGVCISGIEALKLHPDKILHIISAIRHAIGCDKFIYYSAFASPSDIPKLFRAGVDAIGGASYAQYANAGQSFSHRARLAADTDRVQLAIANLAAFNGKMLTPTVAGNVNRFIKNAKVIGK